MDSSGLRGGGGGGGFLSGPSGGFLLDLESPIQRHHQQNPFVGHQPNAQLRHVQGGVDNALPIGLMEAKGPSQGGGFSMCFGKGKGIASDGNNSSEDDEPSYNEDGHFEDLNGSKGKKGSPWQRMKWTDSIVRLLIAVVSFVGDDGAHDSVGDGLKRKSGVLQQKKGKWKTVSKVMISKGCHVSPQQCEDKFNDLNKRYKKLNDILGRGTSCRVVEDPSLMDSMPKLSAKAKEDVKKILSSKHLFYQEMCAYHNGQRIPNCNDIDLEASSLPLARCSKDNNGSEEDEADEDDDHSEEDESDNEAMKAGEAMGDYIGQKKQNGDDTHFWPQPSTNLGGFEAEVASIFDDPSKSQCEQKQWMLKQKLQLEEQRIGVQAEGYELEKRFFKWRQFCKKKERELERSRLENERMGLVNERMVLLLKQKEMEIGMNRPDGVALELGSVNIDGLQGRGLIDLGRHQ